MLRLVAISLLLVIWVAGCGGNQAADGGNTDSTPRYFVFTGSDRLVHGREPWVSDGTEAGTQMLGDLYPGIEGSNPGGYTAVGSLVYFFALDEAWQMSLWKTDGTPGGTTKVKRFFGPYPAYSLINANGTLFFAAQDSYGNTELWKSDGTEAGTVMVKDINPLTGSNPSGLTAVNGTVYFEADDGVHGTELWKSDGTAAGTVMVKDINPAGDGAPGGFVEFKGELYFSADNGTGTYALWKSDGTAAGTALVKDIQPLGLRLVVNDVLIFVADDGVHGTELWKSDGTTDGTSLLKDITPAVESTNLAEITVAGNRLFFCLFNSSDDWELWTSDGTEAGTAMVKILYPGQSCYIDQLAAVGTRLFFRAKPTTALTPNYG